MLDEEKQIFLQSCDLEGKQFARLDLTQYTLHDSLVTVMLTGLLLSPDSDSHQYTPVWDVLRELMLHVDPVTDPQPDEQSDTFSLCVYRLTLHPVESLCPSQLSERESVIKC